MLVVSRSRIWGKGAVGLLCIHHCHRYACDNIKVVDQYYRIFVFVLRYPRGLRHFTRFWAGQMPNCTEHSPGLSEWQSCVVCAFEKRCSRRERSACPPSTFTISHTHLTAYPCIYLIERLPFHLNQCCLMLLHFTWNVLDIFMIGSSFEEGRVGFGDGTVYIVKFRKWSTCITIFICAPFFVLVHVMLPSTVPSPRATWT